MSAHHDAESHPVKGIVICLIAYFFVALIGVLKKSLITPIPLAQILFFQSSICLLLLLPDCIRKGITLIPRVRLSTYVVRIVTGLGCYLCLFTIIDYMPVSQAFLYQYSASLWIPFIGLVWLGHKCPRNLWYGILIGFIGIIFILRPSQGFLNQFALLGILCGLFQGISVVAIRKLSVTEKVHNILFYHFLVCVLFSGCWMVSSWQAVDLDSLIKLAAIGVATFIGQKLVAISLQYASASTLAPTCYTSLIFSGIMGWYLWQELPDNVTLGGMTLVIVGCLLTLLASKYNYKIRIATLASEELISN